MSRLVEERRGMRTHDRASLGRASIQPAVCTGIHEVSSSIPSGRPRRVAVVRLGNGLTTTLRLRDGATAPERGATVLVRGGRGLGDQQQSGGVIFLVPDHTG